MKKKRRFRITPQIIILVLIIVVISRNIYFKGFKSKTMELSEVESYENLLPTNGLIIREEYLISYGEKINTEKEVLDKVSAKSNIGSINGFKNNLELNLDEAKKRADELYKEENVYLKRHKSEEEKDEEELPEEEEVKKENLTEDDIYEKVKNNEFDALYDLGDYDPEGLSKNREELNYLKNRYMVTTEVLGRNGENMKAQVAGILKNEVDGYEDVLDPYSVDLENFEFNIPKTNSEYSQVDGSKIVGNNFYYLYFKLPNSKLNREYDIGNNIKIKLGKEYLTGQIIQIFTGEDETKFLVKFDKGFNLIIDSRFIDFKLLKDEEKSFKVPTSALIKHKDLWGLYVKNPSGIVEFKAVEIIGEKGKYSYVSTGDDSHITFGGEKLPTVDLYDEILLYPKLVKDKELLE